MKTGSDSRTLEILALAISINVGAVMDLPVGKDFEMFAR
jgi:hypothetical protein